MKDTAISGGKDNPIDCKYPPSAELVDGVAQNKQCLSRHDAARFRSLSPSLKRSRRGIDRSLPINLAPFQCA